jgi:hypothetical protein
MKLRVRCRIQRIQALIRKSYNYLITNHDEYYEGKAHKNPEYRDKET